MLDDINVRQPVENALSDVASFVPKLLGAILVLIIGWLVARAIQKLTHTILTKVRFDALVDRSGVGAAVERAGFPDSGLLLAKIVYYGILLLTLQIATGVFGDSAIQNALDAVVALIPRLFVAVVIILIAGAIASRVKEIVAGSAGGLAYGDTLAKVASAAIWITGIFAALSQVEIAEDIVNSLFTIVTGSLALILVIKFGVGGIWAARDRFWPAVYDKLGSKAPPPPPPPAAKSSDGA
ncbi:MAG: hypothetical protein WD602_09700 [Actinomycetota bacterium]